MAEGTLDPIRDFGFLSMRLGYVCKNKDKGLYNYLLRKDVENFSLHYNDLTKIGK